MLFRCQVDACKRNCVKQFHESETLNLASLWHGLSVQTRAGVLVCIMVTLKMLLPAARVMIVNRSVRLSDTTGSSIKFASEVSVSCLEFLPRLCAE